MGEELRPCPYCAKEMQRRAHIADRGHFVWCGNCGAFGPNDITPEHAARMWNLRRPEDAMRAELEQVKRENAQLREGLEHGAREYLRATTDYQTLLADLRGAAMGMLDYDDADPAVWRARIEYLLSMLGVVYGNDDSDNADAE